MLNSVYNDKVRKMIKEIKLDLSDFIKNVFYLLRNVEPNIKYFKLEKITLYNQKIIVEGDTDEGKIIVSFRRDKSDITKLEIEKIKLTKEIILYPYQNYL